MASTTTERTPRRLLPRDKSAVEPYRVTPKLALRVAILGGVLLAIFAALFLRLWALQVLSGQKYVAQAQANSFRVLRLPAPRGLIEDRNGVPIVTNTPSTAIQLWPSDLPKVYLDRYAELASLARISRVPLYEISRGIKARLATGDLVTPVTVRESASNRMVNYLLEHASEFPGVGTGRAYLRHYPYQDLAAQLLGYVGSITPVAAPAPREGLRRERRDRPDRSGIGVRQVSARHLGGLEAACRQSQPPARKRAADGGAEAREHRAPDAQPEAAARGRERARLRHPPRAGERRVGRAWRRDRRTRSA